jgi:hypothetical protein
MARLLARKPLGIVFNEHTTKAALPCSGTPASSGSRGIVSKRAKNYLLPFPDDYTPPRPNGKPQPHRRVKAGVWYGAFPPERRSATAASIRR